MKVPSNQRNRAAAWEHGCKILLLLCQLVSRSQASKALIDGQMKSINKAMDNKIRTIVECTSFIATKQLDHKKTRARIACALYYIAVTSACLVKVTR